MVDVSENQKLIQEFEIAQRENKRVARIISGLIFLIATVNVGYIIMEGKYFLEVRSPEVATELAAFIQPVARRHSPQMEAALEKVLPAYVKVFESLAEKEGPIVEKKLEMVLTSIEAKARSEWPDLQNRVDTLVDQREEDFRTQLERVVGHSIPEEEFKGIMARFKLAFAERTQRIWEESFYEHSQVIGKIEAALKEMHRTEPDLNRPIDLYEASGMLLEFAGVEMQQAKGRS